MRAIRARSVVVAVALLGLVGIPLLGTSAADAPPSTVTDSTDSTVGVPPVDTTPLESTTTPVDSTPVDSTPIDTVPVDTTLVETTTTLPPPIIFAAAGDIACEVGELVTTNRCHGAAISDRLVAEPDLQGFLALGDLQYVKGTLDQFQRSYDPTFGRIKAITYPVVGNHEYMTKGATGYFSYFGAAAGTAGEGWYSFDVGTDWHVVALNSNCGRVDCVAGSVQEQWLRADLLASERPCTLAFWHHPLFSSGDHHGDDPRLVPLWQALLDDGAELVLNGHEHGYERFAPQDAGAVRNDLGVRQIVVGTGGRSLHPFTGPPSANTEATARGVRLPAPDARRGRVRLRARGRGRQRARQRHRHLPLTGGCRSLLSRSAPGRSAPSSPAAAGTSTTAGAG